MDDRSRPGAGLDEGSVDPLSEERAGSAPDLLQVVAPRNGALLGEVPVDGPEQVAAAVERVRQVQRGWASLDPADRARRLRALIREIALRREEIADRIVAETGKPQAEALAEVAVVAALGRHYVKRAPRVLGRRRAPTSWLLWKGAWTEREAYGVVGVISPWNYPFVLAAEPVITALFGGNGVVLKPSEHTPFTGALLEELVAGAGLPVDLVRVVQGRGATGRALIHSGIDKLHFTGSPATGRNVLAEAAPLLLPVSLELGGKDPALVLEDADQERAARGILFGAFFNAGQTCLATERVYVVDAIYEEFLRKLVRLAEGLRTGSGGEVDLGPMTTPEQLQVVEEHLRDAVERGARVLTGGERLDPASNLLHPTVLADVPGDALVLREETFGPLLPVVRVRDEAEGVARANDHPMGLFASVWTGDRKRGEAVARRLRAGGVSVNDTLSHFGVPSLPMGGVGESGFSRVRGDEGLREFTRARSYLSDRLGLKREPWWFPYRRGQRRLMRALVAWEGLTGIARLGGVLKEIFRQEEEP
jgi:acyl-CoA reductase-like NAD-dependent aldehyde dehydrogenase